MHVCQSFKEKSDWGRSEENLIVIKVSLCNIPKLTPRSSVHSLKIRMSSHPCNKYEQIMLSFLVSSVNFIAKDDLTMRCIEKKFPM